jgi:hypothetical protein
MVLPVLCEYETRFITVWREHKLKIFENRLLRGISGSRRREVTGG